MTAEEMTAPKFGTLVSFILESLDKASEVAEKPDASEFNQGRLSGVQDITYWLQGYANMSLEELRETYGKEA